jgi:hypothetical protein
MTVTVLDLKAFRLTLKVGGKRRTVARQIVGMNPVDPLLSRREFLGR